MLKVRNPGGRTVVVDLAAGSDGGDGADDEGDGSDGESDESSGDTDPAPIGRKLVTTAERAAELTVAAGVADEDRSRVRSFLDDTDYETETVFVARAGIRSCYRFRIRSVSWQPGHVEYEYCRELQPPDAPCEAGACDAPSVSLLSRANYRTFEDLRFDPVPVDDWTPDHPATALTRTTLARVRLRALDALAARIEDGETLFPADAAAVEAARDAAVRSVEGLVTSANPLARWLGRRFRPLFAERDAALAGTDPTVRAVAEAFGTYRWIGLVADETDPVLSAVTGAIEPQGG